MEYKILEANGTENENIDGAEFNNFTASGRSGVVESVLNECSLSAVSNTITIATGLLIIKGIRVKILAPETFSFTGYPSEDTNYEMVAGVTLTSNKEVSFYLQNRIPQPLTEEDLFVHERGTYEIQLATFTHSTDGSIKNVRRRFDVITADDVKNLEERFENYIEYASEEIEKLKDEVKSIVSQNQTIKNTNKIDVLTDILVKDGIIDKRYSTMKSEVQITGGENISGLELVDGSYARVTEIQGNSVKCLNLIVPSSSFGFQQCSGVAEWHNGKLRINITSKNADITYVAFGQVYLRKGIDYFLHGAPKVSGVYIHCFRGGLDNYQESTFNDYGNGSAIKVSQDGLYYLFGAFGREYALNTRINFEPMINIGTEAEVYQPYFSGIKSTAISGISSCGKNLIDIQQVMTWTGVGYFTDIVDLPAGNYTLQCDNSTSGGEILPAVRLFKVDKNVGTELILETQKAKNVSGYLEAGKYSIYCYANGWNYDASVGIKASIINLQLVAGEDKIHYEDYFESKIEFEQPLELQKFDSYSSDSKSVKKQTGTIVLTPETNFTAIDKANGIVEFRTSIIDSLAMDNTEVLCSDPYFAYSTSLEENTISLTSGSEKLVFCCNSERFPDEQSFSNYLAELESKGTPLTVLYKKKSFTLTDLLTDIEYRAYNNGLEKILSPKDSNNLSSFDYGAKSEEKTEYIVFLGGDK